MSEAAARAFRFDADADGHATLTFDLPGRRANIFTREALAELEQLIGELGERRDLRSLVLLSGKPEIFVAGVDIDEIASVTDPQEAEEGSRYGHRLLAAWAALPFPTVAAIRGVCVGGGTELSLASTAIVMSDRPAAKIGLPEVLLGIVPAWGGCARLPRRVGLVSALDLILTGRTIPGKAALRAGLADALLPDAGFERHVSRWVRDSLPQGARRGGLGGHRGLRSWLLERNPLGRAIVLAKARSETARKTRGRYPAAARAIEVIAAGWTGGLDAGFEAEVRATGELAVSPVAKHLIHVFRLVEANKKEGESAQGARTICRPALLGAGVMGGGIAALIADKSGLPVRLRDVRAEALTTALRHSADLLDRKVRRGRMKPIEKRRKMALLQPTLEEATLETSDFLLEAIVENLEIKRKALSELSRRLLPGAIVATNTSSLSIDAIAQGLIGPDRFAGMHFFHPVDRMPLVEVILGSRTAPEVGAAIAAFARKLGKTPIVVRDGPGFLVNRLLAFYSAEALWLLDEGYRVEELDRAMVEWGMPMGPLRLADEVGLDVSTKVGEILHEAFGARLSFPAWVERLSEGGRLGVKAGSGIYRYRGRKELGVDPSIYRELGLSPSRKASIPEALAERMVLPMVNEAARCLDEGVVSGPGPLDLAMIFGTGFPPFRGGLCRWADGAGLATLVESMERLAGEVGPRFEPSPALRAIASTGGFFAAR